MTGDVHCGRLHTVLREQLDHRPFIDSCGFHRSAMVDEGLVGSALVTATATGLCGSVPLGLVLESYSLRNLADHAIDSRTSTTPCALEIDEPRCTDVHVAVDSVRSLERSLGKVLHRGFCRFSLGSFLASAVRQWARFCPRRALHIGCVNVEAFCGVRACLCGRQRDLLSLTPSHVVQKIHKALCSQARVSDEVERMHQGCLALAFAASVASHLHHKALASMRPTASWEEQRTLLAALRRHWRMLRRVLAVCKSSGLATARARNDRRWSERSAAASKARVRRSARLASS
jgi:hypothetical protein